MTRSSSPTPTAGRRACATRSSRPSATTVKQIGYEQDGFHWQTPSFDNHLHGQSAHIAQGVDESGNKDEGAGDQGIMFGYATDETPDLMPATLYYSHRILERLAADRHSGARRFLEPDAKSQVTLRYENGEPVARDRAGRLDPARAGYCDDSSEGRPGQAELRDYVDGVFADVLPAGFITDETQIYVNPTGRFEIGGPDGDAGLTGRKIIVDTYGGAAPHGGGAFSGKDPTKVDRSAAYVSRYLAKNVVAAGLARRCTIQLSYAIGVAEPLSLYVDLHGTETERRHRRAARGGAADAGAADAQGHPHPSRPQQADLPGRPPPTAISAASPRATCSAGRRPTWSTR